MVTAPDAGQQLEMAQVRYLADRYRLVERLGEGGMSVVWRGYDEVLGRQVAVKVLHGGIGADDGSRRLVRTEAKAAARLSHSLERHGGHLPAEVPNEV